LHKNLHLFHIDREGCFPFTQLNESSSRQPTYRSILFYKYRFNESQSEQYIQKTYLEIDLFKFPITLHNNTKGHIYELPMHIVEL